MSRPHGNQQNSGKDEVNRSRDYERRARARSRSRSSSSSDSPSRSPCRKRRPEAGKHSQQSSGAKKRSPSSQGSKLVNRDRRERSQSPSSDSSSDTPSGQRIQDPKLPAKRPTAPEPTAPPLAMRKPMAVSIGRIGGAVNKIVPVQMKLGANKPAEPARKLTVASAFCNDSDDSDDEAEEMPAECRMRMRNIGRDTPTSSGPNSFGKTKHGFCDSQKMVEKTLKTQNTGKK